MVRRLRYDPEPPHSFADGCRLDVRGMTEKEMDAVTELAAKRSEEPLCVKTGLRRRGV
jgi:hypothetical protein